MLNFPARMGNPSMSLNLRSPARQRAPAYQQILDAVAAIDSDASVYDPDNPNTRTVRVDGDDEFVEAIADGMGNRPALVQNEAANQLKLVTLSTGIHAVDNDGARSMTSDAFNSDQISAPYTVLSAIRAFTNTKEMYVFDSDNRALCFRSTSNNITTHFTNDTEGRPIEPLGNDWGLIHVVGGASEQFLQINENDPDVRSASTDRNIDRLYLLRAASGDFRQWEGQSGLLIIIPGDHRPEDISNLRDIINQYYPIG